MRRRSVRVRQAPHRPGRPIPPWRRPDPKPLGGVGQHASPSRRRSPVRTRYGVRAPPAATTRPRPAARPPTWWNADTLGGFTWPPIEQPGAARRGGASPPVGTTPPAPVGPRPLYRRVRGSTPRGGSGRATAASGSDGTQTCQPQKLVPSGACECKSRLPHQGGSVTGSRASCAGAYPPLVPAVAGVGTPRRLWSPVDRQRGSGGTVDTPGREPGAHKGCAGPSPAFRTQQASGSSSSGEHPVWAREAPGAAPGSQTRRLGWTLDRTPVALTRRQWLIVGYADVEPGWVPYLSTAAA